MYKLSAGCRLERTETGQRYSTTHGIYIYASVLQSIARFQSRRMMSEISPEQVIIAPGSKPLLFALFDILGGDVILPRPSWVSYEPQVVHAGKKLFWVETDQHNRHTITGWQYRHTHSRDRS